MTAFDIRHPQTIKMLELFEKMDLFTKIVLDSGLPVRHDTDISDPVITSVSSEDDHPVVLEWSYNSDCISMNLYFNSEQDASLIGGIVYLAWDVANQWHLYWETSDDGCEIGSEAKSFVAELGIPDERIIRKIAPTEVEGYARRYIAMYKRMMSRHVEKPVR
ncbi:hypothetical protein IT407_04870 [Candidatus Uhrbacteria bacterium]|nr:hypothetical protein [Candidatus Uhrbacteria bacterium]